MQVVAWEESGWMQMCVVWCDDRAARSLGGGMPTLPRTRLRWGWISSPKETSFPPHQVHGDLKLLPCPLESQGGGPGWGGGFGQARGEAGRSGSHPCLPTPALRWVPGLWKSWAGEGPGGASTLPSECPAHCPHPVLSEPGGLSDPRLSQEPHGPHGTAWAWKPQLLWTQPHAAACDHPVSSLG